MHAGSVSQHPGPGGGREGLEIVDHVATARVSFSCVFGDTEDWVTRRIAGRLPVRNRQVHSGRVVEADPSLRQEADALWSSDPDHALLVMTADCVPVLLAAPDRLAAVHAGWRGLVADIVSRAVEHLSRDPTQITAWIGPAIGPCCYEVDHDVAAAVARSTAARIVVPAAGVSSIRPHLDLPSAAREQLERGGVADVRMVRRCTRCWDRQRWYSYRRDGRAAGHNLALIWRSQ